MQEDQGKLNDGTPITKTELWSDPTCYEQYYEKARAYWESVPATVEGVLGGFGNLSALDIVESEEFLLKCFKVNKRSKKKMPDSTSLDCGAGVGRVSKDLLKKYYSEVHLVEVAQPLLDQAKKDLRGYPAQYFCDSLHTFKPSITYDLAWAQWVLGHLTDDDLQAFLERIAGALSPSGLFIIKENVLREGTFILDEEDSSITRSKEEYERIMRASGLRIRVVTRQQKWPKGLYPVYMWAVDKSEE